MSRFYEVRHYLNQRRDYGFSIGIMLDEWRDHMKFECFMIVAMGCSEGAKESPIYLVKDHEITLYDYFSSDSYSSWQTENIEEAQLIMSGEINVEGWMGIRFELPTLYFHDMMQTVIWKAGGDAGRTGQRIQGTA